MILNSKITGKSGSHNKIIILHGLYGSSDSWLRVAKHFEKDYEVHLLDLRNHGDSFHSEVHTYSTMAEDVKYYMNYHNLEKVFLIGHSMGGKTAMIISNKYPKNIEKCVIADISPRNYKSLLDHSPQVQFHLNLISHFRTLNPERFSTYRDFSKSIDVSSEEIKNLILKNVKKRAGALKWKLNVDAIHNNLGNILDGLDPDDFIDEKIEPQTLFLKGEKSEYITKNDEKLIDFIFSDVKIETVPVAGHWMHIEQPHKVSELIKDFFVF